MLSPGPNQYFPLLEVDGNSVVILGHSCHWTNRHRSGLCTQAGILTELPKGHCLLLHDENREIIFECRKFSEASPLHFSVYEKRLIEDISNLLNGEVATDPVNLGMKFPHHQVEDLD